MAAKRQTTLEKRLREIERERRRVRERIDEVRRMDPDMSGRGMRRGPRFRDEPAPAVAAPVAEELMPPVAVGVLEMGTAESPENAVSLDFEPGGPEGLDTKRVVMPQLQRTDLLRPSIGATAAPTRLGAPEHDRFRNYFGTTGLKRVREARREQGNQRLRALFMMMMVFVLAFILLRMLT